jgi:hypothetical protein
VAEVKGKFIMLAVDLIKTKPEAREAAIRAVKSLTGRDPYELDPEGWYDTRAFQAVFSAIEANAEEIMAWASIKVIGRLVYPTIRTTVGLPPHLITPVDFIRFEADGFMANHRGHDVVPRKFIKAEEGEVIVEAPSPGYDCVLIEGVYEGILQMCGFYNGSVRQTRCRKNGDPTCLYHVTWSGSAASKGAVDWSVHSRK